jgi:hypothetical protein
MFTFAAFVLIAGIAWYVARKNEKERKNISLLTDDEVRSAVLHARQDIRLVAFLLAGVLVMLALIADRMH